jgi:hypothetical protein
VTTSSRSADVDDRVAVPAASPPDPARGGARTASHWSGRGTLITAIAVTAVPLVVALIGVLVEHGFALHGDGALIELRVRDVGGHTPLVGSYQRFGWNQPGPLLFYLLVAPYRILGSTFAGLEVGALLVNVAAIAGVAIVAFRRGGIVLLLWALTLAALLVHSLGTEVSDPWEPRVIVLPCVLLLFLAFDVALGGAWSLPIAAGVASFLAQAYAGVAPLALALFAFGLAALLWNATRGPHTERDEVRTRLRAVLLVTAAVLAVLWLPPVVDQLRGEPGNISEMWRFFREPHDTLGLGDAYSAVALQSDHAAPWLTGDVPLLLGGPVDLDAAPLVPVSMLLLGAGLVVAVRRRDRCATALALAVLVAAVVSVVALSRLVGEAFPWILGWTGVVGLGCWLAAGWAGYRALPVPARVRADGPLIALLALALVAISAVSAFNASTRSYERDQFIVAMRELGDRAADVTRDRDGPVLVEVDPIPLGGGDVGPELLVLALERAGVETVVEDDLANRFGDHRAQPNRAATEARVFTGDADVVPAGYEVVATVDPLTRSERTRRDRLVDELRARGLDGSLAELQAAVEEDPEVRRLVDALGEIEDLPQLTLATRDRADRSTT